MAQHTVIIPCIADTYNDSATPNTNYGAASFLKMNNNDNGNTLLCFNFNDYNIKRKKIVLARLYLFFTTIGTDTPLWFVQYPIRNKNTKEPFVSADENVINFNNTDIQYSTAAREHAVPPASNSWVANYITALFNMYNVHNYEGDFWFRCYYDEAGYVVHSRENTNAPYIEVVYEDVPPSKPTLNEPVRTYESNSSDIRFTWNYISSVGGTQKGFNLQWSTDQENWQAISQITEHTYCDIPAGTLPSGNIYWRVQTINEYDETSEYSDIAVFYSVGAPSVPTIYTVPNNTARPVISWTAFDQQIYQVQVLSGETVVYDSGEVPGINVRQHKATTWLADGEYTARVRIKNEYNMWSDWGSATFMVSTTKPEKPSFCVQATMYGIELYIQGGAEYFLVYRAEYGSDEYACITKVVGNYHHDCSVKHGTEYLYFVRAVSASETYADSEPKLAQARIKYSLIAPASDLTDVFTFKYSLNSPLERNYSRTLGGSSVEFEGRQYPVWIPNEHASASLSLKFFLQSWGAVEKFMRLYDHHETVLYRDIKGRKIYGFLSSLAVEEQREGHIVSFIISQVDYDEELEV